MKAMLLPSGLHTGELSDTCAVVRRRGAPPATSTSQRLDVLLFFSMEYSCTVNATVLPSGESAGPARRLQAQRSCGVIGRLSAAHRVTDSANVRNAMTRGDFM